jgi:hypothetical protein
MVKMLTALHNAHIITHRMKVLRYNTAKRWYVLMLKRHNLAAFISLTASLSFFLDCLTLEDETAAFF